MPSSVRLRTNAWCGDVVAAGGGDLPELDLVRRRAEREPTSGRTSPTAAGGWCALCRSSALVCSLWSNRETCQVPAAVQMSRDENHQRAQRHEARLAQRPQQRRNGTDGDERGTTQRYGRTRLRRR